MLQFFLLKPRGLFCVNHLRCGLINPADQAVPRSPKDGVTELYSKGANVEYSVYPHASSTGGASANYFDAAGKVVTKIRLQ